MRWKTLLGIFAAIGSAVAVVAYRHRRIDVQRLGPVSETWIAEHAPDDTE